MTRRVRVRLADLTPKHIGCYVQVQDENHEQGVLSDYKQAHGWTELYLGGREHFQATDDTPVLITDRKQQ